jgi:hypothetical protein
MAAGRFVVPPYFPARDRDFNLLSGAKLYVYVNETTTKALIYTDESLTTLSANPVIANSSGQFPAVYAEAGTEASPVLYSVSVTTSTGASPGNPFNFDNYRPSVDWETAAIVLAEDAAELAEASAAVAVAAAGDAAGAAVETAADLAAIEAIIADSPDAPSVLNKLNRNGDNAQAGLQGAVGTFSTRAEAAAATILSAVQTLETGGYAVKGDGGCGLYTRQTVAHVVTGASFQSADGAHWWYVPGEVVNAHAFGVKADASRIYGTGVMSGTDSVGPMQNAIDFGVYFAYRPIWFTGTILISKSLHLGYGGGLLTFAKGVLLGSGKSTTVDGAGSVILCNFLVGMGVNIQGARGSRIEGVMLVGKNFNWPEDNRMANVAGLPLNGLDDRVFTDWIDPALPAAASARYSPYSAVTIDGYAGTAPGVPYPTVTYPSWTGLGTTQYGKAVSSNYTIEDCGLFGFVSLITNAPNTDGNGDFLKVINCYGSNAAVILAVGNTQSRNVQMLGNVWNLCHTGISTGLYGSQNGRLGGVSVNEHYGQCIQIISVANDAIAGPFLFDALYGEECWRLGDWAGAAAGGANITFRNPLFSFGLQGATARGVPSTLLGGVGRANRSMEGGVLQVYDMVPLSGAPQNWAIRGTAIQYNTDYTPANLYEKIARNFTGGGWMWQSTNGGVEGDWPVEFSAKNVTFYDVLTGTLGTTVTYGDVNPTQRAWGVCGWTRDAYSYLNPGEGQHIPPQSVYIDLATEVTSASLGSDGTLTVVFTSRTDAQFAQTGGEPGDLIQLGNTVFKVRSRTGTTVLAKIANNFEVNAGVYTVIGAGITGGEAVDYTTGRMGLFNCRRFLPNYYTQGNISTSTTPTKITAVGRDDGFATYISTEILADDWFYVDAQTDGWVSAAASKVTLVDAGTKEITLNSSALKTRTQWPLPFINRKPPTNV